MDPEAVLRTEGVALVAASTTVYFALGGPLWLFLVLALAPDIGMLGYLAGPRTGSRLYNALHTYTAPVLLGALGVLTVTTPAIWVALVWGAHIGADRAIGYGLKYPTGFKHTHLSRASSPGRVLAESAGEQADPVPASED